MTSELAELVREQVEDVLRSRGGLPFLPEDQERLEKLDAQLQGMLQDRSLGRIMGGPLWLSGASVLNGTVTAEKLVVNTLEAITTNTGTLNVTGSFTAAASYPALTGARVVISSAGVKGYNASDAQTFNLLVDGSGFIGIGTSKVSWNTSGVVTVPAAAISSLTIADVGSGTFNNNFDAGTGRVRAGTALQRVEITSAGLAAYNTGGTQTFLLSASDGSLTHTGVHTIRNAASGARVELSNVGLRGYNSSGIQTFGLSTSDGSGFLGVSGGGFSWNSSGTVVINGSLLVGSSVTADKLTVSSLSAISANLGTITAGTITGGTISAGTITTGTLAADRISGGSVGGSFNLGSANLTVNSTGVITNNDGDTWGPNGLVLKSTGAYGDSIKWNHGGSDVGSITGSTSGMYMYQGSSGFGTSHLFLSSSAARIQHGSSGYFLSVTGAGIQTGGPIYPGTTGLIQSANSLSYVNEGIAIVLGDAGGTYTWDVRNSNGTRVFGVSSNGSLFRAIANDATAVGAYYGRVPFYINGSLKYLAVYS